MLLLLYGSSPLSISPDPTLLASLLLAMVEATTGGSRVLRCRVVSGWAHGPWVLTREKQTAVEGDSTRLAESELQQALTARAARLRHWLAEKIPSYLQAVISVEDVLQEIWIAAFRSLPTFRQDRHDALDRWLTCIAQRITINGIKAATRLKRGGRQVFARPALNRASSLADLFANVASPGRTPSGEAAVAEAVDAVQIALASLPAARRQAIWMRYIEGQSCDAIARVMHRTKGAVNSLLFHGLNQLQVRLGKAENFLSSASSSLARVSNR